MSIAPALASSIVHGNCPKCEVPDALRMVIKMSATVAPVGGLDVPPSDRFSLVVDQVPTVFCSMCDFEAQGFWSADCKRATFLRPGGGHHG